MITQTNLVSGTSKTVQIHPDLLFDGWPWHYNAAPPELFTRLKVCRTRSASLVPQHATRQVLLTAVLHPQCEICSDATATTCSCTRPHYQQYQQRISCNTGTATKDQSKAVPAAEHELHGPLCLMLAASRRASGLQEIACILAGCPPQQRMRSSMHTCLLQ